MAKILVSDKLSPQGLEILKNGGLEVDFKSGLSPDELKKIISSYDGWVIRSGTKVTPELIDAATRLKVIGRAGIGVDNVDLPSASRKGIVVMNTPSGNAVTTAEHAIAMMFAVSRKIPQATASMRSGLWEKTKFMGSELCNKVLGVVGVGNIGKIVADRALGLKMKVIGYDPFLSVEAAEKMGIELVELEALFKRADYISVHTPLTDKTKGLIDKAAFAKMKKGVYIINCARGGIVSEADLVQALKEGIVAGAALDVFEKEPPSKDDPLLKLDQVIFTPHLGAATDEAQENVALEVAEQIVDYFKNGTIRNAVNFPSITAEALKYLQPYLSLAEKLGSLQGQLISKLPKEVTIEYKGEIAERSLAPVTIAFLKGFLSCMMSDVLVNYVNAPVIAKERGLKVVEAKVRQQEDYASLLTITLKENGKSHSVAGTIFGRTNPRLVKMEGFDLEAVPEGKILVVRNYDKPGVIGNVGTLLGQNKVNISRMQLGLEKGNTEAIALYNVEGDVTPEVIGKLEKLPNIISVKQVIL